jgi:protein-arginine kinase activator protein McsA
MPSDNSLLFGKIALSRGYCTQEKLDWALAIQSTSKDHLPLGRILVNEGYLTEDQHSEILTLQRKNMKAVDTLQKKQRGSLLFGKLAVREGFLTAAEANECLREQAKEGEKRSLGEIMVSKGYLTSQQVTAILAKQYKKIMSCPACRLSFTVLTISKERKIDCPRCKGPLADGKPSDSMRTDGEFATRTLLAAKREAPPDPLAESRVIPPNSIKLRLTCTICGHPFEGVLDSTGRVRCPSCQTTFVPK